MLYRIISYISNLIFIQPNRLTKLHVLFLYIGFEIASLHLNYELSKFDTKTTNIEIIYICYMAGVSQPFIHIQTITKFLQMHLPIIALTTSILCFHKESYILHPASSMEFFHFKHQNTVTPLYNNSSKNSFT